MKRSSPPLLPLDQLDGRIVAIIKDAANVFFNIAQPRDFQYVATAHLLINRDTLLAIIRKTADGKTLIPQLVSAIKRGVCIYLEPLVGLASDQVDRLCVPHHQIESFHVDEHRETAAAKCLIHRLKSYDKDEAAHVVINALLGPKSLTSKKWKPIFRRLAEQGLVSFVCIDEVHFVEESGRFFRPEFNDAVRFLGELCRILPTPIPRMMMSATARKKDIDTTADLLGDLQPTVMHAELSRRDTAFLCVVSGSSSRSLISSARQNFAQRSQSQHIYFTHSRTKAEGGLRDQSEKLLDENRKKNGGTKSIAQAFVGTDGIMMKTTTMDAIKKYDECEGIGSVLDPASYRSIASGDIPADGEEIRLPKVQCIIATKAAEAGVNGPHLEHGKMDGLPSTLYELVQMLGRCNRKGTAIPGSCTFEIHLDGNSYASLFLRIMKVPNANERKAQLAALHLVLSFLVTPTECYHSYIEKYFEWEQTPKTACGRFCSYCLGQCGNFTKRVNKDGVISFLSTKIVRDDDFKFSDLSKTMKSSREQLFYEDDVPKGKQPPMGQFHALSLQLFAKGILALKVKDDSKIGTNKLQRLDLTVVAPLGRTTIRPGLVVSQPAYLISSNWTGFNLYNSE